MTNQRLSNFKLAIFIPNLNIGGAERAMVHLAEEFSKRGLDTDLVVIHKMGTFVPFLPKGIKIVELCPWASRPVFLGKPLKYLKYLGAIPALISYSKKNTCMITSLYLADIAALIVKKYFQREMKLIVRIANTFSMEKAMESWAFRLLMGRIQHLLPVSDAVVTNSRGSARHLKEAIPGLSSKIHAIYNPIFCPELVRLAQEAVEHPWTSREKYQTILYVGRLERQKDLPTLLKSFQIIIQARPDTRLILLGTGKEKSRLESLAAKLNITDYIDFAGHRPNPYAWMAKANLLVLTSLFEGCPNVLIESLACSTPVVSTDCPNGPREILDGGRFGKLVPVRDPQKMAQASLETLDAPPLASFLRKRAEDFSVKASADHYLKLWMDVTG